MTAIPDATVWVGLDVGKAEHFADVLADDGDRLFAVSVPNDETALERVLDRAATHGPVAVAIDQPGSIAQLVLAVCARRTVPVAYIPGLVMRRAADLYPGESKTDRRDAYVIADTARTRRRQVTWIDASSDELLDELRVLNGYDADLAVDVTRTASHLRDTLTAVSPALERVLGERVAHPAVRALLAAYPTPTALRAAGPDRIEAVLVEHAPRLGRRLAGEIAAALDAQTVTLRAEAPNGRVVAELAVDLGRLHQRRDSLAEEIEQVFLAHPFGRLLVTIPGIGPRTGAVILAEIGDGTAFANGSKLAAYAGLAPVARQSGTSLNSESRSRRGNHRLKNAMFMAAFCSRRSPDSRAYYDRKRAEGKRHNAAVMCLARRRCDVILAILTTQTPYTLQTPPHSSEDLKEVA